MRLTNFELLRIIAMLFIVFHHMLVYVIEFQHQTALNFHVPLFIDSFLIIAVNSFVLLSGYWGIKVKLRGFLNLYLMCAFYNLISLLFAHFYLETPISLVKVFHAFLPFSHSFRLWFIQDYMYLYLLSPLLNLISNATKKSFISILIFLSILNIYFGFLWQGNINKDGANVMNFIYLYLIGKYLSLHCINKWRNNKNTIMLYIGLAVFVFLLSDLEYFLTGGKLHYGFLFGYNNPIIIVESIAFFLIFRNLNLKNATINAISISSLSVYLLHENVYISNYLYSSLKSIVCTVTIFEKCALILAFSLALFAISISLDKIRILFLKKVEYWLETVIDKLYKRIMYPLFCCISKYL